MATTLQKGLLGYDPLEMQLANQKMWSNMYGQAQNPYEKIGLAIGQVGSQLFGGETAMQSREAIVNKALQTASQSAQPGTPEYWTIVAQSLPADMADSVAYATSQAAAAQEAAQKSQEARVKFVTENPEQLTTAIQAPATQAQALIARLTAANGGQPLTEAQVATLQSSPAFQNLVGLNAAQAAGKVKAAGPVGEIVNRGLYELALEESGGDPRKAAIIYNQRELAEKQRVAAAGVPSSGQVPLTVLGQAINIVDEFTAKPKTKLDQIKVVSSLGQGVKTNPTLLPQFQREAVKFAGDNQISAQEVNRVLGSSGFAADTIDGINKFLTGAPTNTKIDDVLKGFKVLEATYAKQYETGRQKARTVLSEGKINEQTVNAVLPPAYVQPIQAPAVGTVKNGYQFTGGDPSKPANWKAVK